MKKIQFIHGADLHLDSPMVGLRHLPEPIFKRLQESSFTAFAKLIDAAIHHQVDFVILAGDIFDGENRSIRAQSRFRKQIDRLALHQIPVFIVHGNHDYLDGKWARMVMPENAFVFPANVEVKTFTCKNNATVNLYGFSYSHRHVMERKIDDYQKSGFADFHIGILHGHCEGSNDDHGKYAPFTLTDLFEKQFDYWALGHIHKRSQLALDPPIIYPGNIQGRHRKEMGEKGCYFVTLTETDSQLDFISLSDIIWEEINIDVSRVNSIAELYKLCRETLNSFRKDGVGHILTLKLEGVNLSDDQIQYIESGELMESLQDEEKDEEFSFVWPLNLSFERKAEYVRNSLINEADFFSELFQTIDKYDHWDECLAPFYQQSTVRKFVSSLSEEDKKQILTEAEHLLVKCLKQI